MKNTNTSKEKMYCYLEKWRATDLDMKTFCKNQNISYHSFKYWKYRQRDEKSTNIPHLPNFETNNNNEGFLPMQIETEPLLTGCVLNFPNGVQLNCPLSVGFDDLVTLIKAF